MLAGGVLAVVSWVGGIKFYQIRKAMRHGRSWFRLSGDPRRWAKEGGGPLVRAFPASGSANGRAGLTVEGARTCPHHERSRFRVRPAVTEGFCFHVLGAARLRAQEQASGGRLQGPAGNSTYEPREHGGAMWGKGVTSKPRPTVARRRGTGQAEAWVADPGEARCANGCAASVLRGVLGTAKGPQKRRPVFWTGGKPIVTLQKVGSKPRRFFRAPAAGGGGESRGAESRISRRPGPRRSPGR